MASRAATRRSGIMSANMVGAAAGCSCRWLMPPAAPFSACNHACQATGSVCLHSREGARPRGFRRGHAGNRWPLPAPLGRLLCNRLPGSGCMHRCRAMVEQKAHFFALDLPHSDACFVRAFPAAVLCGLPLRRCSHRLPGNRWMVMSMRSRSSGGCRNRCFTIMIGALWRRFCPPLGRLRRAESTPLA